MKGVLKCYGLVLVLFITFMCSLNVCLDVNAKEHRYVSIPSSHTCLPPIIFDSSLNKFVYDWDSADMGCYGPVNPFILEQEGDAFESQIYDHIASLIEKSASYMTVDYRDNKCVYDGNVYAIFDLNTFVGADSNNAFRFSTDSEYKVYSPYMTNLNGSALCHQKAKYGDENVPSFDLSSIPPEILYCDRFNGAKCAGWWKTSEYIQENILPYSYTFDGIYLASKYISAEGIHYSNTFSFNQIFTQPVHKFSYLQVPLYTDDAYFVDSDNFYSGRHFEFKGAFEFDGSFNWHENFDTNGSFWRVHIQGQRSERVGSSSTPQSFDDYATCSTNFISLETLSRLEYTCNYDLPYDLVNFFPVLEISGNHNYVFTTDKEFRFAYTFLTTDNDSTKGDPFGNNVSGANPWAGNAKTLAENANSNAIVIDGVDFSATLGQLFGFNFLNPFAPLFNLFNNQDSCVNIPIIAGMLHSENTQVCPWFPSSVRNIATPVLGIASIMLIFGFAVRWLGASSGNMFEDSGGVDTTNYHFESKFRRKK